jgi:hypothetical protein
MTGLYLTPGEIESRLVANVAMYENDKRGLAINTVLADHWRDCLHKFHDYQEGRIALAELPLDVREMGWTMPAWGTYGT